MNWDKFKDINKHESEIDPLDIWGAIEPQVNQINKENRKKRGFIFWFFLLGVLMPGSLYLYSNYNSTETATSEHSISKNSFIKKGQPSADQAKATNSIPTDEVEKNKNEVSKTAIINKKQVTLDKNISLSKNGLKNKGKINAPNESESNYRIQNYQDASYGNPSKTSQSRSILISKENALSGNSSSLDKKKKLPLVYSPSVLQTNKLQWETRYLEYPNKNNISLLKSLSNNKILLSSRQSKRYSFDVSIYGGISAVSRTLNSKSYNDEVLKELRNKTEKPLEAIHYGFLMSVRHKTGFQLSTGLGQTIINESLENSYTKLDYTPVRGESHRVINLAGDTIPVKGMINLEQTSNYDYKVYNEYRLLEIPLYISYGKDFNRWRVGVNSGVLVNLSLKTKGKIMKEATDVIDIQENQAQVFKSRVGIAYLFGFSIERKIGQHLAISLSPHLRYYNNDFTISNYSVSQNYVLIGGSLKLSYRL